MGYRLACLSRPDCLSLRLTSCIRDFEARANILEQKKNRKHSFACHRNPGEKSKIFAIHCFFFILCFVDRVMCLHSNERLVSLPDSLNRVLIIFPVAQMMIMLSHSISASAHNYILLFHAPVDPSFAIRWRSHARLCVCVCCASVRNASLSLLLFSQASKQVTAGHPSCCYSSLCL